MTLKKLPGSKVEIAPHVHNTRYASPSKEHQGSAFHFIAGYEECDGEYSVSRSSYPYLILEMIVGGCGRLNLNGEDRPVSAGTCFCGGPGSSYSFTSSSEDPIAKYFIVFGIIQPECFSQTGRLRPGFQTRQTEPHELRKWNELILAEGSAPSLSTLEDSSSLVGILVRKVVQAAGSEKPKPATDALVSRALRSIEANFKSLSTLQDLAGELAVSSEHLCRVFKANNRASPYQILMRRKMEHAYAQLKTSRAPIQEIAFSLGFSDSFHFSRAFKKHYGLPPSQVR